MRRIKQPLDTIMAAVAALFVLGGCGGGQEDLEQWAASVKARPPAGVETIPEIRTLDPVTYDAYELRDPFSRARPDDTAGGTGSGPRPDPDRRREYLEQFPLDSLSMVGTIEIDDQTFGLIQDVEGTIHRVREGNYLGQNHGRILRVTPVTIELMELVPDGADGWMEREASIALPEEGQG